MKLKLILQVVGFVVLAFIGLVILLKILGFISIVFSMVLGVALLVGFVWVIWKLLQLGGGDESGSSDSSTSYKLFNASKSPVALFVDLPGMADLLAGERVDNHPALVDSGKILEVGSNVSIKVLDDSKSEVLRVKVLDGPDKGTTGWVARSAVVKNNS